MSVQKHHHTFAVILLSSVALLFVLIVFTYYNPNSPLNAVSNVSKQATESGDVYRSDFLGISFIVPEGFVVEDKLIHIALKSNEGEIALVRVGTNHDSVEGFLFGLEDRNELKVTEQDKLLIDNKETIRATINYITGEKPDEKVYYIYYNNEIYAVSTTSPELYDELDQVAQSFRYTGESSEN